MKPLYALAAVLLLGGILGAAEPAFEKKPSAVKAGDAIRIDFTADRNTDAAVTIEDANGKVVRHLVAGVLGKNPPAPLKPDLRAQSVAWDGKDDFGKVAAGGPFKARVQLGMKPEFGSSLMHNPHGSGTISAVAVGPGGALYVFHRDGTANENMGGHKIKVYTREGKHQKVLVPFPATIDPARVKALGTFRTEEGDLVPHIHNWETLTFYPENVGIRGRDMPEYTCPAVDSKGRVYWLVKGPALAAVDADGGIPFDTFLSPRLLPEIKNLRLAGEISQYWSERPCLAVSSDDKYVYFAGLSTGTGDYKTAQPLPCVFRVPADRSGPAKVFVGKLEQPGKEKALLTSPRGLTVAGGLLYVADPGSDRVVAFKESDGSFMGEFGVESPQVIGIGPGGEVHVCASTGTQTSDLIKFDGVKSGKELYRLALPRTGQSPNVGEHRIAVDATAKPVRIWVPSLYAHPNKLTCIEDTGTKFTSLGDPRDNAL